MIKRELCKPYCVTVSLSGLNAENLLTTGAILLISVSIAVSRDKSCIIADRAFYNFCSFRESFCPHLFSLTDITLEEFIADSAMLLAADECGSLMNAIKFRNTCDTIRFFVGSSTNLSKSFNEIVSIE